MVEKRCARVACEEEIVEEEEKEEEEAELPVVFSSVCFSRKFIIYQFHPSWEPPSSGYLRKYLMENNDGGGVPSISGGGGAGGAGGVGVAGVVGAVAL